MLQRAGREVMAQRIIWKRRFRRAVQRDITVSQAQHFLGKHGFHDTLSVCTGLKWQILERLTSALFQLENLQEASSACMAKLFVN